MNIAELSIRKKTISSVMIVLVVIGGIVSYQGMARLEDPEFTIKDALVITPYPGATAAEVEEEVTDVIEIAAQQLGQLKRVWSKSERGLSTVQVKIKDKYDKQALPQVWDELRRKVGDARRDLPPGAGEPLVYDDFGDVFGVFLAITGDGYTYEEVRRYADMLRRELLLCQDVKKVDQFALQPEVIYVELSRAKLTALMISPEQIAKELRLKNAVVSGGRVEVGDEFPAIAVAGEYTSVEEIGNLLLSGFGTDRVIYLKDVAQIRRGYQDPASVKLRFDGKAAIGIAISTVLGGNVVAMGESIEKRLEELESDRPVGMELGIIAYQSSAVTDAINAFIINLLEAVGIVIMVLLLAMGLRSGLIIGSVLMITILATFMVMKMYGIILERISLGALIIALGMLVDNAIVITEGMLVRIQAGEDRLEAARQVVNQNKTPLLGATVIAILAFGAIGLSQDNTGEYCRSLFYVLLISLMMSWVTAVTITPLFCYWFIKPGKKEAEGEDKDPYAGRFFQIYRSLLVRCIRFRWITVAVMVVLLVLAVLGFGWVDDSFFPQSTRPQFLVDVWLPKDTHIEETTKVVEKIEKHVTTLDHVTNVASVIGQGAPRFMLTYDPEKLDSGYAQLLVEVDDYKNIDGLRDQLREYLADAYPDIMCNVKKFILGPNEGGRIQARFRGHSREHLRKLAEKTRSIVLDDGGAVGVRIDWREKVKVGQAVMREAQARRAGIVRTEIAATVRRNFEGYQVGLYRERNRLLPIIMRSPEQDRSDIRFINDLQAWSPVAHKMIPLTQVVSDHFGTVWEDGVIWRRHRLPTIKVHADQRTGNASDLLRRVGPSTRAMFEQYKADHGLSDQYTLEWGGEDEDSRDAQTALAGNIPMFVILMVLIVIFLFDSIRQPLIIWLCVPLAIIGVTVGLLTTGQPFGFMALLGMLSLSGMLIKNSIVLIDQINLEIGQGKDIYHAIVDSGVSRMRPVLMAAMTTVMGMTPLVFDAFYVSMAVTIMFGLSFAAVLTLLVVPVLYAIFYRVPNDDTA